MKENLGLSLLAVALLAVSGTTLAQDYEYHPGLSDHFDASLGWFRSDNTFKIQVDGINIDNEDLDLGKNAGVDQTNTLLDVQLRWKFGSENKWSLWGQHFKNDASGEAVLKEDTEWGDVIFREGSYVGAGVSVEVIRLFVGRSFIKNDQNDFGAGIGIHNLDLGAYIEGEILINDEDTGFHKGEVKNSAPLPNLGAWYLYSPAKKWLLRARVDWISANVGDYNGTLWNSNVGVNYQMFRHVGLELSYQYFNIDLKVDGSDWRGGAEITYSGPVIALTANW